MAAPKRRTPLRTGEKDAAEGIVLAAGRYTSLEPVNLGSGIEISMKALAATIPTCRGTYRAN